MAMSFESYMRDMSQPMRDDLTRLGIQELRTPDEVVEQFDAAKGTSLVVVNSVCGCAAGQCRPGVAMFPGPAHDDPVDPYLTRKARNCLGRPAALEMREVGHAGRPERVSGTGQFLLGRVDPELAEFARRKHVRDMA